MAMALHWNFISVFLLTHSVTLSKNQEQQRVLLISFDGFRWDYVTKFPMFNFRNLIENGVHVKQVTNIFITKTYPNHYTMVTGLYAENHGIVANEMFDPVLNETFSMNAMDIYKPEFWEDAVPIWVTNQQEGHSSGAAMWPGSDVRIHNVLPSWYMRYNESVPFEHRVDMMIEWFNKKSINLGLLYWEEPGSSCHYVGPDDPLMEKTAEKVDVNVGYLMDQLKKANLWGHLNIIVTSDHSMSQCSLDRIIELDMYIERNLYTFIDYSPVVSILPKEGKLDEVYKTLANAHPNMTAYKKEDIPVCFHYKKHVRIQPLILVADVGWSILRSRSDVFLSGNHGYDHRHPDMHPLLIASGPAFKTNFTRAAMNSTDLYPLLCHLLNIRPLPSNGSLSNVMDLLVNAPLQTSTEHEGPKTFAAILGPLLGFLFVAGFILTLVKHYSNSHVHVVHEGHSEMTQPLLNFH